jgi:nitroimidazol reductase NimA-like FMN-containing flavoprotein (pyridoxamine 5'-phosphate oxidase superfamily)
MQTFPSSAVNIPFVPIRRKDRAIADEAWIAALLHRAPLGVLATVQDGQPFINSNLFVYDESQHVLYMHTARTGRTRANVDGEERICFSVSEMGRLLPASIALEMSVEYTGVVVFGRASVVANQEEATYGLNLLLDKYFRHLRPGVDYRPIQPEELARTAVYRIAIDAWSGKQKRVETEFPGAFLYESTSVVKVHS